jgi:hypothetical protein
MTAVYYLYKIIVFSLILCLIYTAVKANTMVKSGDGKPEWVK